MGPGLSSMANSSSDGRSYGLMPWSDSDLGGAVGETIPSLSELLRGGRHDDLDGMNGNGGIGNGGNLDLTGSLDGIPSRIGEAMKFELDDDFEEELGPFLCDLGPRGPTAMAACGGGPTPCGQKQEMRGRPGCSHSQGHYREHRHVSAHSNLTTLSQCLCVDCIQSKQ